MHPNARLIKNVFRFSADHPKQYEAARELVRKASSGPFSEDELLYRLGVVVYSHSLVTRRDYLERANALIGEIDDLVTLLPSICERLSKLDGIHFARIQAFLEAEHPNTEIGHLADRLLPLRDSMLALRSGIVQAVETEKRPSTRSRPQLPYIVPAAQLADVWVLLTQQSVVAPKGVATAANGSIEATQPSTEFIRLGLTMIDPAITAANAITLIKRVLGKGKQFESYFEAVEPEHGYPLWHIV